MPTAAVGLFEAKTHLSEYVARAERGEEVIITRHNKPVAKIVPLHAQPVPDPALKDVPPFIQKTYGMGVPLVDLTQANKLVADMEDAHTIELMHRLEAEAQARAADGKGSGAT